MILAIQYHLGISLLSRSFDRPDDRLLAAFLGASIPIAVLQASTTQTNLIASFWIICFAYFIFKTNSYSKKDPFWLASSRVAVMDKRNVDKKVGGKRKSN